MEQREGAAATAVIAADDRTRGDADRALVARLAGGDEAAFDALVARYEEPIRRLVYRLSGWRGEAGDVDDLVQDVFVAALAKRHTFRGDSTVWTWLAAVAIRTQRASRRKRLTRLRWLRRWWETGPRPAHAAADDPAERDESAERVRDAIRRLPPRDREVIVLHHLEGLPPAEVATSLGISRGAVDVRLHRARQRLKRVLGEAGAME